MLPQHNLSPWSPLFAGESRDRLYALLQRIADVTDEPVLSTLEGEASRALLHGYLAASGLRSRSHDEAANSLQRLRDALAREAMRPSMFSGMLGLAWVTEHLSKMVEDLPTRLNDQIDQAIWRALGTNPWQGAFDLIEGLVGFGLYSLERLPRALPEESLHLVVDRLAEIARPQGEGLAWFTPPNWLSASNRREHPSGRYDLGMAHGTAGVLAFLGAAASKGISSGVSIALAEGSAQWLVSQARPVSADGLHRYPNIAGESWDDGSCRDAWCYGDPGVGAALFMAGRAFGRAEWVAAGLEAIRGAASRPPERTGSVDPWLCHGAAGLGHLFNRVGQACDDATLMASARQWLLRAAEQYRNDHEGRRPTPCVLQGTGGLGLALLAAISPLPPGWDRLLILSS